MEHTPNDVLGTFFSAAVGSVITIITAFFLAVYRTQKKADGQTLKLQLDSLQSDRALINNAHEKVRTDLQSQILDLRKELLGLQADNLKYVRENAELRQQVIYLTQENGELKLRLHELESQVAKLTDGRISQQLDVPMQVQTNAANSLGTAG